MRKVAILVSVALAAGVLWVATPASACTFIPSTEEEYLARAELVFEGIAASSHDPNAGAPVQSSGDPITWMFIVDRRIKGNAAGEQAVSTARNGATCGVDFTIGVRYRVFATQRDGVFVTSLGSGTREAPFVPETTTTTKLPAPKRPLIRTG